ncbi:type II secretion system protein GspD [Caminibacter sp.]
MKKILFFLIGIFIFAGECKISYINSSDIRISKKMFLERILIDECGYNLSVMDEESEKFLRHNMPYVKFKNQPLRKVLDYLLGDFLFFKIKGRVVKVKYSKTKKYSLDFIPSVINGSSVLNATNNQVFSSYKFDFWGKILSQIKDILKSDSNSSMAVINKEAGVLIVRGSKRELKRVDKYVKSLTDSLNKEVLIEVKIYSVELSKNRSSGINWNDLSFSLDKSVLVRSGNIFGKNSVFNYSVFNVNAFLNFLSQNGNVNSLSNPRIITLNNQKAIISIGDTVYYKYASKIINDQNGNPQTEYTIGSKFVGVVLDITPKITENNEIILNISPKISAFRDINQLTDENRGMPPDTRDNVLQSVIKIKNNETVVLGGLISSDEVFTIKGVPVLKEIPLIKYIFSSKEKVSNKKELVFVITPKILKK